jgi:hypothetical protein
MTTIDATALTLDVFSLSGIGQFGTSTPRSLALAPGNYRFGTLFGPGFEFLVTGTGTVDYDPGLTFLSGAGTAELKVNGCQIQVDAAALTFDQFSLLDTASGLGEFFSTGTVQTLTLIPGDYRFGTLFGPIFLFSVTGTGTVDHDPGLTFLSGAGTAELKVNGCPIQVDATALTFDQFSLFDTGSGLGRFFPTGAVQTLTLIPGNYQFGTLFGPTFVFSVTGTGTVDHDPGLIFLSGTGTAVLKVDGCPIQVDATALTLDQFSLSDTGSGLGRLFLTTQVQTLTLIPGDYHLGTLFGPTFMFSVTGTGTVSYDPALTFLSGAGTTFLTVNGFLLSVDATHLTLPSFTLNDSGSGLGEPFVTTSRQCVTLLPGPYAFTCGFSFGFAVTGTGVFDYDPGFASCVKGLGTQRLRVSCDPMVP